MEYENLRRLDNNRLRKCEYQKEYQREKLVRVVISLSKEKDGDLIEQLENRGDISVNSYIKKILRDHGRLA